MKAAVSSLIGWFSHRRGRSRIRIALLAGACAAVAAGTSAPSAGAHWYGFTGDLYYCGGVVVPTDWCWSGVYHSYSFNSAKNLDAEPDVGVCAKVENYYSQWQFGDCALNFVRSCIHGEIYPNCHDEDGNTWKAAVKNNGVTGNHIRGHGEY